MSSPQDDFTHLSNAIANAILRSEEVKGLVAGLQSGGRLRPGDIFGLALKFTSPGTVEVTLGQLNREGEGRKDVPQAPPGPKEAPDPPGQFVDGEKLSESEIAFQEQLADRFDEEEWLRKARLRWDSVT